MWPKFKKLVRENKKAAVIIAVLLAFALVSVVGAYKFHSRGADAEKKEKAAAKKIEEMAKESEAKDEAFRKAIEATDPALKSALRGVKEAGVRLIQAEAGRREFLAPPSIDNLASRFDRALEALR
jgi:flagellar basal body-associated protein FliL